MLIQMAGLYTSAHNGVFTVLCGVLVLLIVVATTTTGRQHCTCEES